METAAIPTKLLINLRDGIVDVQGSEEFVRSIYQDFKEHVSRSGLSAPQRVLPAQADDPTPRQQQTRHRKQRPRTTSAQKDMGKTRDYRPKFNRELNLVDLPEMYRAFAPDNNSEKILLFAIFLRDRLKKLPCTVDDIFTCFFTMKDQTSTPEAFIQAFRNAESRTHFIEFNSLEDIQVTIAGDNRFNDKMKKKEN